MGGTHTESMSNRRRLESLGPHRNRSGSRPSRPRHLHPFLAMASSASSSSSSSAASASTVGAEAGVVQKTVSADAKDSCMWYGGDECGMPRSCYDCLNTAIQSDSVRPTGPLAQHTIAADTI